MRKDMNVVELAELVATVAHAGQADKAGAPYINHPRRVATNLMEANAPEFVVAAGWLHDVVEDTTVAMHHLKAWGFPLETLRIVQALTKHNGQPVQDYASGIKLTPWAATVKRADVVDNSDPARLVLLPIHVSMALQRKYDRLQRMMGWTAPQGAHGIGPAWGA